MRRLLFVIAALSAWPLLAHEYRVGGITIDHPFTYISGASVREGYLILVNDGAADRLLGVDGVGVFLADADGAPLSGLDVPAGGAVELLPGGPHVRFTDPGAAWEDEAEVMAPLLFQNTGPVPVAFYVEPRP